VLIKKNLFFLNPFHAMQLKKEKLLCRLVVGIKGR
jgi:hypothetical protein